MRIRPPAADHAKPAVVIVFLVRDDAQADFLLEHQRQAFPEGRPLAAFRK